MLASRSHAFYGERRHNAIHCLCSVQCKPIRLRKTRDVRPTRSRLYIIILCSIAVLCNTHIIIIILYTSLYTPRRHTQSKQEAGNNIPLQERTRESHSCLYAGTRCLRISLPTSYGQESASTGTLQGSLFS